jgi:DNA-binding beta-propeller fold protein YncE
VWGIKGSADNTNTGIWWVEQKTKKVIRGSSTGAATATLFDASDGLLFPRNIALDEAHGKIYVLDIDANNKPRILTGNLDGSGSLSVLPVPVASLGSYLYDLEIDTKNGYLYWITPGTDASFMRCNTDGTNVQTILEHLNNPGGYFDILLP